ncbi:MAG TPA: hypothetical protein VD928_00555, partial [Candidatus Paceibacterota bacterium]|nr:hypothetical protein [Candidatus Paceibacterota bacterium]
MVVTTVMSEPSPALENSPIESAREDALIPYPELGAVDICTGADPYVFQYEGKWRLLMQEDIRPDPHVHTGIDGYTIRSADRIEDLPHSTPVP